MALSDHGKESGGLNYLLGSHLRVVNHSASTCPGFSSYLEEEAISKNLGNKREIYSPYYDAGDVSIHHPNNIHYARPVDESVDRGFALSARIFSARRIDEKGLRDTKNCYKQIETDERHISYSWESVILVYKPDKEYTEYIICNRNRKQKNAMINSGKQSFLEYNLYDDESNERVLNALKRTEGSIDVIYSSYSNKFRKEMNAEEQRQLINANCRAPIDLFNILSRQFEQRNINGVFISSMYAGIAPNPSNYKTRDMQNPLLYGVAKAGVEQGLRWLSCQNKLHRYNALRLGPMPKTEVNEIDPKLISNLKNNLVTREMVGKDEVGIAINFMLNESMKSMRGVILQVDGGYSIW